MQLIDRIRGGLYGVAVGDALGGTTEFMSRSEIMKEHGNLTEIIGGGVWNLDAGEVTDDTMMTLCVAEGILANPLDPMQEIGGRFLQWYRTLPKDVGNIIRHTIREYDGNWYDAAIRTHSVLGHSAGNGSLMRCLPVALCYPKLQDVERVARMQSKMTHYDERCNEACEIYSRIVYRIMMGETNLQDAIESEIKHTDYEHKVHAVPDCEPSGFVVHTFRWVLHILLTSASFAEVVQKAANLGGDSDTIGAIAGGVAGVYFGYLNIPELYSSKILIRDRLDEVCKGIGDLRGV
ncbi:MAG: ADP-ribosylglycohydrolase family protein [Candidatus Cohnella colombiensis]|uniref:ADP-ribosylglycohydrolase family protein n=1 Tax=Candidatus Cohnella colombiensis TaxID=3121368 RepID=A0AA95JFG1_9BACL|nr:MAG: ADP-ribosylglycohydrolase family protein [Cohnella sp.]